MSTAGTAFTPGTATLKGRLTRPGSYSVGGLTAGTAYYFKLRGADPAENYTDPSDAVTGFTGQTLSGDLGVSTVGTAQISFNARTIGGVTNSVQATAPSSPLTGDVWLDTSPGTAVIHKVYNGSTWVTNAWGSASIAAGQITARQLAAGAVTAGAITAGTVNGWYIQGGTISGNYITGGTIAGGYISGGTISGGYVSGGTVSGASITTAASGARIAMNDGGRSAYLDIHSSSARHTLYGDLSDLIIDPSSRLKITTGVQIQGDLSFLGAGNGDITCTSISTTGNTTVDGTLDANAGVTLGVNGSNPAFRIDTNGDVFSKGIEATTTANAANVRLGTSAQLIYNNSTARIKHELIPLANTLMDVSSEKLSTDAASVNVFDVLDLAPTEFQSLCAADEGARMVGFIAEDVAVKFPFAADFDEDGLPVAVQDRPILAALLAVVQQQQQTITDLTARIEALEG